MKKQLFIIGALALSQIALAAPPQLKEWKNPECDKGSCEVKAIRLYITKDNNGKMAGNFMTAEIETSDKSLVKKYGFVQYVRGCYYQTSALGDARMGYRQFFGKKNQPFKHPVFQIDSADDADPVYNSTLLAGYDELRGFEIPRNKNYTSTNPDIDEKTRMWGGKEKNLQAAKIFTQDTPSMSMLSFSDGRLQAATSSMQFKTCLYDMSKIPTVETNPSASYPDPIACLEWSSNYIYNFQKKIFEEKSEVSPVCLK